MAITNTFDVEIRLTMSRVPTTEREIEQAVDRLESQLRDLSLGETLQIKRATVRRWADWVDGVGLT